MQHGPGLSRRALPKVFLACFELLLFVLAMDMSFQDPEDEEQLQNLRTLVFEMTPFLQASNVLSRRENTTVRRIT